MTIEVVTPDDGELLQTGPARIRVLEDGSGTAGRLGVVEVTLPPGADGPPQHVHRMHDETFFVLSGRLWFTSADETVEVEPGSILTAPVGMPHTFGNADPDGPTVLLGTVTPHYYINYFRELAVLTESGKPFDPSEVLKVMSRYATEPYKPAPTS